jgi:hypothetical protein
VYKYQTSLFFCCFVKNSEKAFKQSMFTFRNFFETLIEENLVFLQNIFIIYTLYVQNTLKLLLFVHYMCPLICNDFILFFNVKGKSC